ncbi:MAG: MFS transporter [Clostridia bacterium]|nr:MFS transporter [Clostridia bacterium]
MSEKTPKTKSKSSLGIKTWIVIWVAGLAGQLAWNIENQWFNTFVYGRIGMHPWIITAMVSVSAIISTFSTFLSGTWSDRLGKRKPFIVWGYILWGVFTIVFGVLDWFAIGSLAGDIVALGTMVIFADALMSFFGSLGNDAGFNPHLTDITTPKNRGPLGAVIAVQPVIATIIGTLLGGLIIAELGYFAFFLIMGCFVVAVGIYCQFAVKDAPTLRPNRDEKGFWHQFASAFNFKLLWKNKLLLIVFCIFALFFISFNIYFPYITIYFIHTLGIDTGMAGIWLGIGLVIAIPFTLLAGKFINKQKFVPVLIVALIMNIVGLCIMTLTGLAMGPSATIAVIVIGVIFIGGGYMCIYQALMIWCKNLYPDSQRGQLEGVRLLFYVCIPMISGPVIADPIVQKLGKYVPEMDYNGVMISGYTPTYVLFGIAAGVALLTFIPIILAHVYQKKHPGETLVVEEPAEEPVVEDSPIAQVSTEDSLIVDESNDSPIESSAE